MTPRVVVTDKKNINVSVMCPICKGMILRDKTAYIHHMTNEHGAEYDEPSENGRIKLRVLSS